MAKQTLAIELDAETIRCLGVLGKPVDVLIGLAAAAAEGVRDPARPVRERTDTSLRVERDKTDETVTKARTAIEVAADEVARAARERSDAGVEMARADSDRDRERTPSSAAADGRSDRSERARADDRVAAERSEADEARRRERSEERRRAAGVLAAERAATDKDLTGERVHTDAVLVDQREANAELVKATLRAQEMADELRAVAQFRELLLGIVSHDLRTPLATIVLSAGMLLQNPDLDPRDAEATARIIRSTQRMTRMITQLLDFTKARLGGGLPIEPRPIDLRDVFAGVVEEFEATVAVDLDGDLTGTWDRDRLMQVLSNVTGNAIEHAARGTTVVVSARGEAAEVVVEIRNQGDPIPADVMPYIFEPFRRGPAAGRSKTRNLGLGLYIASELVHAHGGTLEAQSSSGVTTFTMRLPRHRVPPPSRVSP